MERSSRTCESFTDDIVVNILLRLPVKSLLRFKCVSKQWQSLICDRAFRLHLQRLKAGDMVSSQRIVKTGPLETIDYEALDDGCGGDDRAVVEFHDPDPSGWPDLVGSCDGLVCLSVDSSSFILYNPTTKESRNLPGCDLFQLDKSLRGFGYDSRSDDYKIVQRKSPETWQDTHENWQVAIFSLKSGSWRSTQAQLESHLVLIEPGEREGVYWNGALHWCVVDHSKDDTAIISFNLSEEKFQQVLPVPKVSAGLCFKGLGIHRANLFMYHGTNDNRFQAWIMSEHGQGGSWMELFSVSTETIPAYCYSDKIPVAYTRGGKIVFRFSYKIILFNPEDNTYKEYPIQRSPYIDSANYVETLVSPYHGYEPSRI